MERQGRAASLCTYRLVGTIRFVAERTVDAVVFDYGGVLTPPIRAVHQRWLDAERIDGDGYRAVMREWLARDVPHGTPVHLLETGELSDLDFETALAARLRDLDGAAVPAAGLLGRMLGGMRPVPEMVALLRQIRDSGVAVGLLSNSWGTHDYPADVLELCAPAVISGRVGLRKPDPRIYRLVLDGLGVPAERVVFVDDAPVNIDAAQALGMRGIRHRDPATTRAALAALLPTLAEVTA